VIDSRDVSDGVRRRRQCESCEQRFTTYERIETPTLYIIKKDGRREEFRREKLLTGVRKACEKRPLPPAPSRRLVDEVQSALQQRGQAGAEPSAGRDGLERLPNSTTSPTSASPASTASSAMSPTSSRSSRRFARGVVSPRTSSSSCQETEQRRLRAVGGERRQPAP
jgi:hypothetical protein